MISEFANGAKYPGDPSAYRVEGDKIIYTHKYGNSPATYQGGETYSISGKTLTLTTINLTNRQEEREQAGHKTVLIRCP